MIKKFYNISSSGLLLFLIQGCVSSKINPDFKAESLSSDICPYINYSKGTASFKSEGDGYVDIFDPDDADCLDDAFENTLNKSLIKHDENLSLEVDMISTIRQLNVDKTIRYALLPPVIGACFFQIEINTSAKFKLLTYDNKVVFKKQYTEKGGMEYFGYPPSIISYRVLSGKFNEQFISARKQIYENVFSKFSHDMELQKNKISSLYQQQRMLFAQLSGEETVRPVIKNVDKPASKNLINKQSKCWGNAYVLVVGISECDNDSMNNLIYADDDAIAFASAMKDNGIPDDQVKLLVNKQATLRNIKISIESWLGQAGKDDLIIFYWAGHGYYSPDDPEKAYLACYDTDIKQPASGIRMKSVIQSLKEHKPRNVILIADTCHAGKLVVRGENRGISIKPFIQKQTSDKSIPKGWIYMVAADSDRKALEDASLKNGVFTHFLLKAIEGDADGAGNDKTKDGKITMQEIKDFINNRMPKETYKLFGKALHPIITTSSGDPDIWNLTLGGKK